MAADKGTAPFSDTANAIAADYGFWLDDAFASGGSNGYDHKEVGITAGGAWESVKRHFREMGRDIQEDPFTVAGIGDMSGDVFGNGMLLSRRIRLVAAFDHRHVFIDPDPDPESSFAERERLFTKPRSSWDDYDRSLLSQGGMIVRRGVKSVDLTAEARDALGLSADVATLDGESLIRAVLKAPVDLLWNGGIGTYVKADHESHADAGDTSNDPVRVDADDLRAKVVGEGGNLGFTQTARVQYALRGGRINTDALDNSGGVNLSDREVNLKILLNEILNTQEVTREERNDLVDRLTDPVAALVLRDNESGCQAVSFDEYRARSNVDHFWALMTHLSRSGLLDRDAEGLPSWDQLSSRKEANQSLTRPELAVLLSYAKLHLKAALLASDLPDDPSAADYFFDYFPFEAVHVVGRERAANHRLRREIVACQMTNDLVDLMGSTFVDRLSHETGREPWEIARAWLVAAQLTQHRLLLNEIRSREGIVPTAVTYRWSMDLARVLERTTRWVLTNCDPEEPTENPDPGEPQGPGGVAPEVPRDRGGRRSAGLPAQGAGRHEQRGRRAFRAQSGRVALPRPPARDPPPGPRHRHRPGEGGPRLLLGHRGAEDPLAHPLHRGRGQVAAALGPGSGPGSGRDSTQLDRERAFGRGSACRHPGLLGGECAHGEIPPDPGRGGGRGSDQPRRAVGRDPADPTSGGAAVGAPRSSSTPSFTPTLGTTTCWARARRTKWR